MHLNEWVTEHYTDFGASLEFITDKSPEGFQFCKGFMGFGGFLRYKMDLDNFQAAYENKNENNIEDDFI